MIKTRITDMFGIKTPIVKVRKLTDKPFGVNFTITSIPFKEYRRAIIASKVKIVEIVGRSPVEHRTDFKPNGAPVVIHKCTSMRHRIAALKLGVDVFSIDGFECVGHPGEDSVGLAARLIAWVDDVLSRGMARLT